MKTCEEYEALISDFLDGELSAEDRAEVAEHLASCPACQQYFDDLVAMHDAFDQIGDVPVPEGFTEQLMARVHETPQSEEKKIIFLPHWKRWAALAACCAIAALGLWSAQRWAALPRAANQTVMAESAPSMARDAAPPSSEEAAAASDALTALMMDADGEDGGVYPQEAPEPSPGKEAAEAQKQYRDASGSSSDNLPEIEEDITAEEADAGYVRSSAYTPEPAMPAPASTGDDQGDPRSGIITASGETARTWVENELGLEWEPGRTYLLTEEEYAGLLSALTAADEDFRLEPEEGCWLVAE